MMAKPFEGKETAAEEKAEGKAMHHSGKDGKHPKKGGRHHGRHGSRHGGKK